MYKILESHRLNLPLDLCYIFAEQLIYEVQTLNELNGKVVTTCTYESNKQLQS